LKHLFNILEAPFTDILSETSASVDTRQRLLDAAGEVFAKRGFRNSTIREICRRARANLAAVNYHFGDKQRLYAAVMEYAHARAREKYPLVSDESAALPPAQRLHTFIHHVMFSLFAEGVPSWPGQLMAQEMIEPTAALDALVENTIRPMSERLAAIVGELLGAGMTAEQVRLCQMSIIGQCLHPRNARPVIQRIFPQQQYGPEDIAALADHITRFSLAALRGLAKGENAGMDLPPGQEGQP
jgi:TetR/AcrR family transcriptional regulator, regulator of cefoperazone and chloramphenicol sensitivity